MFGWFKGNSKEVIKMADKGLSGIINGIDAAWYTDEEKARDHNKRTEFWLESQRILRDESTGRTMTRRIIACGIMFLWIFSMVAAGLLFPVAEGDWSEFWLALADRQEYTVLAVTAFYYGPALIDKAAASIAQRLNRSK